MASFINTITPVVAKIVVDAKIEAIDNLIEFIKSSDVSSDVDEIVEIIQKFKEEMIVKNQVDFKESSKISKKISKKKSDSGDKEKKKRPPSMFNLFVKDKMPILKANNPEHNSKMMMSLASDCWKSDEFALYIKDNVDSMKKEFEPIENVDLFKKMKETFAEQNPDYFPTDIECDSGSSSGAPKSKPKKKVKPSSEDDSTSDSNEEEKEETEEPKKKTEKKTGKKTGKADEKKTKSKGEEKKKSIILSEDNSDDE